MTSQSTIDNPRPLPAGGPRRAAPAPPPLFQLGGVRKQWRHGADFCLEVPELVIRPGEMVALVGVSGCGKSTLLDMLAMILRPDQAQDFRFACGPDGEELDVAQAWRQGDQDRLTRLRRQHLGYVLQTGGLFPFLTVRDNLALGRRLLGLPAKAQVEELAERLGIARHLGQLPARLSVGQRQRVAIARALAHQPRVVIADEPTASLDPNNARAILELFGEVARDLGVTLILSSHDWEGVADLGFRLLTFRSLPAGEDGVMLSQVGG